MMVLFIPLQVEFIMMYFVLFKLPEHFREKLTIQCNSQRNKTVKIVCQLNKLLLKDAFKLVELLQANFIMDEKVTSN